MISIERLREVLHYDPDTGIFTWKVCNLSALIGRRAGAPSGHGYRKIKIDGRRYYEHHLAWLYMTGEWLVGIDHRDLDGSNNRCGNLRPATQSQNNANVSRRKHNTTGFKGVTFNKVTGKYRAQMTRGGRCHYLGEYSDPRKAHAAYCSAAVDTYGEFARAQ